MSRMVVLALVLMALIAWGSAAEEFGWGHRTGPIQTYYDVIISDENFTINHVDLDAFVPQVRTSMTRATYDTLVPAERTSMTRAYFNEFVPDKTADDIREYFDEFVPPARTSSTQAYFTAFASGRTDRGSQGIF